MTSRLVAEDAVSKALIADLADVARTRDSILLHGETGVGKEVVARFIHSSSPRRERPFVPFNCGTAEPGLLAATLFGSRRGAFTGACDRAGLFKEADGGTLFLDEIGELPLDMQVSLLRVMEDGQVRPVGGREEAVNVRIVAATNRDPSEASGKLRQDLQARFMNVAWIPPLRERRGDVGPLALEFLAQLHMEEGYGDAVKEIAPGALEKLAGASWPDNARGVSRAVRSAFRRAERRGSSAIELDDLPSEVLGPDAAGRLDRAHRDAATANERLADEILDAIEQKRRETADLRSIAAGFPDASLRLTLCKRFLGRYENEADAAAKRLFGYASADAVRAVLARAGLPVAAATDATMGQSRGSR
ncbi:MAG: sigma-54-dependent Fis family transcriptional regulator [Acidobacteria bacterium]|nr:sigma-54-dependent Fis family transcriptional regulator [Acidobacteriota bacterium]